MFEMAELCKSTAEEYRTYQNSQKMIYAYENTIDYAREEGEAKGREEGRAGSYDRIFALDAIQDSITVLPNARRDRVSTRSAASSHSVWCYAG